MIEVKLEHKAFFLPESWEEINKEVLERICPFLLIDTPQNRIEVVKAIAPRRVLKFLYLLRPDQVYDLTEKLGWMYQGWFDSPYIQNFKVWGEVYLLPEKTLKRCSVIEYAYADKYFEQIVSGDSGKIDYLIASLCRPRRKNNYQKENWDGDERERFNPVYIEERAKKMSRLSIGFKMYFLLFFIGCKKSLQKRYPPLFREREDDEESSKKTAPDFGWVGAIWDLAGSIVNEEAVQYSNLHNIMAYMCKRYYDNKELERQQTHANELS